MFERRCMPCHNPSDTLLSTQPCIATTNALIHQFSMYPFQDSHCNILNTFIYIYTCVVSELQSFEYELKFSCIPQIASVSDWKLWLSYSLTVVRYFRTVIAMFSPQFLINCALYTLKVFLVSQCLDVTSRRFNVAILLIFKVTQFTCQYEHFQLCTTLVTLYNIECTSPCKLKCKSLFFSYNDNNLPLSIFKFLFCLQNFKTYKIYCFSTPLEVSKFT